MKRCECGSHRFEGHMIQRYIVACSGADIPEWQQNIECYDNEDAYGPFVCTGCGKEFDEWEDIPDAD